jgi:uncharacterized membrane protein YqjE
MTHYQDLKSEPSLGHLFSHLSSEISTLVREETRLAKAELAEKGAKIGRETGMVIGGGLILYAGFLTFLAALVLILAEVMAFWLAALLVAVVVIGAGYMLVQQGLSGLKKVDPVPHKTIQSLKEDKEWMTQQLS